MPNPFDEPPDYPESYVVRPRRAPSLLTQLMNDDGHGSTLPQPAPAGTWVNNPGGQQQGQNIHLPETNPVQMPGAVAPDPMWGGGAAPYGGTFIGSFAAEPQEEMQPYVDPALPKPTMDPNALLKDRVSVFGQKFPHSTKANWEYYKGAGWVCNQELSKFGRNFCQSSLSKEWSPVFMFVKVASPTGAISLITKDELKARPHFKKCIQSGYYFDTTGEGEGTFMLDSKGNEGYSCYYAVAAMGAPVICDYYKKPFIKGHVVKVYGSEVFSRVSILAVQSGKFRQCKECERHFQIEQFVVTGIAAPVRTCKFCLAKNAHREVIKPWDHKHHPELIKATRDRLGHVIASDGLVHATHKKEKAPVHRYFGVELEVELDVKYLKKHGLCRFDVAREIHEAMGGFILCKEDGSLTLNGKYSGEAEFQGNGDGLNHAGFEIVSAPASLDAHRKMWERLEHLKTFPALRSWDTPTCGFHVHFSKAPITNLQLGKMLVFINLKRNRRFLREVAGRGGNKYCVYSDRQFSDAIHPDRVVSAAEKQHRDRSRRVALNVCNEATIEYRGFKGTVHPRHIIRNIEFCDALIDFCGPSERSLSDVKDYRNFVAFVDSNRKTYPRFAEWLVKQEKIAAIKIGRGADPTKFSLRPESVTEAEAEPEPEEQPKIKLAGTI